ncbi:MAG: hypothetical protein JWP01_269 [Myxococcales bacterium]|nr:hypothetical protein [Myxococcales bacterium]
MMRTPWLCLVMLSACANNVPQDRATGPDGRLKGAQRIALAEGEGRVRGIVTYPGGDRVDWKLIELPAGKRGKLDLQMSWTTPRPGLKVAFDVFDQWNTPVIKASTRSRGRSRNASITGAMGKYFVRIYAPGRGDAGAYNLTAAFLEDPPEDGGLDVLKLPIPDPPRLPDVPVAADPVATPTPPPVAPPPVTPPTPPITPPVTPAVVAAPLTARVLKIEVTSSYVDITVSAGSEFGVAKTWKASVLTGQTTTPLSGGAATVVRVDKRTTVLRVNLSAATIQANNMVRLSP